MPIQVERKQQQQAMAIVNLDTLVAYKVVEVVGAFNADDQLSKWIKVGDVVVKLPHVFGGFALLNATTGLILPDNNRETSLNRLRFLQDFTVRQVCLTFDSAAAPA
jgi:hypothetical protein